jgi:hypothetical protein
MGRYRKEGVLVWTKIFSPRFFVTASKLLEEPGGDSKPAAWNTIGASNRYQKGEEDSQGGGSPGYSEGCASGDCFRSEPLRLLELVAFAHQRQKAMPRNRR